MTDHDPLPYGAHGATCEVEPGNAQLRFYFGTMGCGKSTTALQINHNLAASGRRGTIFTRHDRGGDVVSSRVGLTHPATVIGDDYEFYATFEQRVGAGDRIDYVICDEVQFFTARQVDQLAAVVDTFDIDVYAFGLTTDFRSHLFDASRRLFELADVRIELHVEARCWCGRPGSQNARVVADEVVFTGAQVMVGDIGGDAEVRYELLCRRHWRSGVTAQRAAELGIVDGPRTSPSR